MDPKIDPLKAKASHGFIKVYTAEDGTILVAGGGTDQPPPGYEREEWTEVMKMIAEMALRMARRQGFPEEKTTA